MPIWVLVVYGLATARLTGLITDDAITEPARQWILRHLPLHAPGPFLAALLDCPWCAGVWVAAMVAPFALWTPTTTAALWPATILALAQFTGMIAAVNRPARHDDPIPAPPPVLVGAGASNPDGF
jgi:hypothetical protein